MSASPTVVAAVGLGSNLDDPVRQVGLALEALAALPDSRLIARSRLYRNPPMGPQDQPDFVNACALVNTALAPIEFLRALQAIERAQGRVRRIHWGPRTIDLDILLWGDRVVDLPDLKVPHPGLHERNFVLYPLAEIDADLWVPGRGAVRELLRTCPDAGLVPIAPHGPRQNA